MTEDSSAQSPLHARFGMNMRRLRRRLGLGQRAIADALGVSTAQVVKYEKGRSSFDAAKAPFLANILKATLIELYEGVEGEEAAFKKHRAHSSSND